MRFTKTLEIQNPEFGLQNNQENEAVTILREFIKTDSTTPIHLDIITVQKLYAEARLNEAFNVIIKEDRLCITDKNDVKQVIIFYRQVSEQVTFRVSHNFKG